MCGLKPAPTPEATATATAQKQKQEQQLRSNSVFFARRDDENTFRAAEAFQCHG